MSYKLRMRYNIILIVILFHCGLFYFKATASVPVANKVKILESGARFIDGPCDTSKGSSCITIPNVFSPNNDGKNDVFKITSSGLKAMTCGIFNRWGVKLWDLKGPEENWDGRDQTGIACSTGTYFYILDAVGVDGKAYHQSGFVELIR